MKRSAGGLVEGLTRMNGREMTLYLRTSSNDILLLLTARFELVLVREHGASS